MCIQANTTYYVSLKNDVLIILSPYCKMIKTTIATTIRFQPFVDDILEIQPIYMYDGYIAVKFRKNPFDIIGNELMLQCEIDNLTKGCCISYFRSAIDDILSIEAADSNGMFEICFRSNPSRIIMKNKVTRDQLRGIKNECCDFIIQSLTTNIIETLDTWAGK